MAVDHRAADQRGRYRHHHPNGSMADLLAPGPADSANASPGNITTEGPVNVGTQDIITGGTLLITGISDEEVGGDAYKQWNAITTALYRW